MPLAPVEQSIQLLIGAEQQLLLYHTINQKLGHCYLKTITLNLGRRCGITEIVCHWSLLMLLELAEQSIQLLKCHISRWRLCTSRAEHTTSYRGRATTSFISYHQLKTWSLLSEKKKTINLNLGRRCGQTEIVCHWSLLMSLELAEQSIQLLIGAEQQILLYHTIN